MATTSAAQEQLELTFDQARIAGRQAALNGDAALALQFANSLLQANDQDFDAWVIRASALHQLGDASGAGDAAASAYRTAPSRIDRYEAARLAALSAVNTEQFTRAQWWLRLALINAPNAQTEAQTLTDAAGVSAQNPWQTNLTFSLSPSENVNGGTESSVLSVNGVATGLGNSADALALDGWAGSLAFSTRYRLSEDEGSRLTAGFNANWRGVFLSDAARASLIADNRYFGNDPFSSRSVEVNLTYSQDTENGSLSLGSAIGSRFTFDDADAEIERYLRLSVRQSLTLDPANVISISAYADKAWEINPRFKASDDLTIGISGTYIHDFQSFGIVSGTLAYTSIDGNLANHRSEGWTVSAAFQPREQIGPFDISGQLGFQFTDYPDYGVFGPIAGGRQDNRIFAGLDLAIPDFSFAGFEPVITIDASRSTSNVSRFEYDSAGIGLTFQSSF